MDNRMKIDISNSTILKIILAVVLVWFFYAIREVVLLFFIVVVIVSALGPLVDNMSKYVPRFLALIILALVFIGGLTAVGFLIIPPVVNQIGELAVNLPSIITRFGPIYTSWHDVIISYQSNLLNISSQLSKITSGIYSTTLGFIGGVVAFFTVLVLSFYMLLEENFIKNFFHQVVAYEQKEKFSEILGKITSKMGKWLRGQCLLMLIIGFLDGIVLLILGIPYTLTLAVWGGLTEVIPYIGPCLGIIPAVIIAYTISPIKALFVIIAYVVIQQLEAQFLVPKIMGKAVGLSPVIIIFAILVGAKLMGVMGVLVAIPAAAAIAVIIQYWSEIKKIRE